MKTAQCQLTKWYKKVRVLRENSDFRPDYAESKTSLTKYYIKMTFSNQKGNNLKNTRIRG